MAAFSPDGYLYDKQAILEYILHQKTEVAKKMKVSPAPVSVASTQQLLVFPVVVLETSVQSETPE